MVHFMTDADCSPPASKLSSNNWQSSQKCAEAKYPPAQTGKAQVRHLANLVSMVSQSSNQMLQVSIYRNLHPLAILSS